MQGDKDFEHTSGPGKTPQASVRAQEAGLRVFVMRAAAQIEQTLFPLMDTMLGELQARIERSGSNAERQQLSDAFVALHKRKPAVLALFSKTLREMISHDLVPGGSSTRQSLSEVSLQGLSLVNDEEMAEEIEAKRTSMKIETAAEWELRELTSLISALQGLGEPDQQRNPLRPELLSRALHRALQGAADESGARRILENTIGDALANAMRERYSRISEDLKRRNVQPLEFAARTSGGTGSLSGLDAGPSLVRPMEQVLLEEMAQEAQLRAMVSLSQSLQSTISTVFGLVAKPSEGSESSMASNPGRYYGGTYEVPDSGFDSVRGPSSLSGPSSRSGPHSRRGPDSIAGWSSSLSPQSRRGPNPRLKELLMDLRGNVWGAPTDVRSVSVRNARGFGDSGFTDSTRNARSFASTEPYRTSAFGPTAEGAMLNPVRAHLQQLQAATKEPYRLTIEIVALVFDAILADKLLQPLLARLIARLQLPLLDIALNDAELFARPQHPLHALMNRLGSAAVSFDAFESGPGQRFYAAALTIVEEILESDFYSLETYRRALDKLNAFIKHESALDNPFHSDAAQVLALKEHALYLEHHLSKQVKPLISRLKVQPFLRDFFEQTWVQLQVIAVLRFGENSPESHRYSRMYSDLVWSVQPKVMPEEKRQLTAALPHLMRDVNEAFALLKWPALSQKDFRAKLIEHQARAIKGATDGDSLPNMHAESAESRDAISALKTLSVPTLDEMQAIALGSGQLLASTCVFTEAECAATGFLRDEEASAEDGIDVPLFAEPTSTTENQTAATVDDLPSIDEEIGREKNRSLRVGDAYELKLKGSWRKLRLAWVSDLDSFYLFVDCADAKKKTTLSAKTLMRLWRDAEIRAFEPQALMSRAIEATRRALLAPH